MVTKQAEVAATEVTKGLVGKIGLPVIVGILGLWFVWTNWDSIQTASRKLDAVDGNTARSKANTDRLTKIELMLIDIKDFEGDMTGTVSRLTSSVKNNTDWSLGQEKRATTRIAEQGFREERLKALEKKFEALQGNLVADKIRRLEQRIKQLESK